MILPLLAYLERAPPSSVGLGVTTSQEMANKNALMPTPSEPAPWYRIPKKRQAVSVEHPCIVKNFDKAIETLGGDQAISEFLREEHGERPINLKLHPEDSFSQPMLSSNRRTENVLLQVTVPKRTGRKRKRGSTDPYVEDVKAPQRERSARYLLQSLKDNQSSYQLRPVASIPTSHVFRAMPDFFYSTSKSRFLNQFRDKVLPQQYQLLSEFQLSSARGLEDTEIIPPAALSTMKYPQNYAYRQNPAIKAFIDPSTGSRRLYNTQAPVKIWTTQCQYDSPPSDIPAVINPAAPPLESEPHNLRGLVTILQTIFARRPIWTRRGLANQLPSNAPIFLAKYAIAYVAYAMRSGPWRDTYILLGIDPRSNPKYRKYQTLMLQLVSPKKSSEDNKKHGDFSLRSWRRDPDRKSHIFTGEGVVPLDGKLWQLCDLHEPLLKKLVDIPDLYIRDQCENRYFGWYLNGTWCKLKIILKAKIDLLQDPLGDEQDMGLKFERLLNLPDDYTGPGVPDETLHHFSDDISQRHARRLWLSSGSKVDPLLGFLPRNASRLELEWASLYRALCRAPQGKLPAAGRLSKSKEETRASYIDETSESGDENGEHRGTNPERQSSNEPVHSVPHNDHGEGIAEVDDEQDESEDQEIVEMELEDEDEADEELEEEDGEEDEEDGAEGSGDSTERSVDEDIEDDGDP